MTERIAGFTDDTVTWIDPSGRDLSQRIWVNRAGLRAQIDRMIADAMARGLTVDEVTTQLVRFVSPDYARSGEGRARYAANRLAGHEMSRAHGIATRDTAIINPTGGFLRWRLDPSHAESDICDDYANRNKGYGRGVYPAKDAPLPPVHIGDKCRVEQVGVDARGMDAFVDQLRVEYRLEDPPDLSPDQLAIFRQETAQIRQDVQLMFRAWFEQTGLVSREALVDSSPTVQEWVEAVQAEKRRAR